MAAAYVSITRRIIFHKLPTKLKDNGGVVAAYFILGKSVRPKIMGEVLLPQHFNTSLTTSILEVRSRNTIFSAQLKAQVVVSSLDYTYVSRSLVWRLAWIIEYLLLPMVGKT